MNNDSKYMKAFIAEAQERLQDMNSALLELEKEPGRKDLIDELFRHAHTIKGGSASLGYKDISMLAHDMENLMDELRSLDIKPDSSIIGILFESFDMLETLIVSVARQEKRKINITPLITELRAILTADPPLRPEIAENSPVMVEPEKNAPIKKEIIESVPEVDSKNISSINQPTIKIPSMNDTQSVRVDIKYLDKLMNLVGELVIDKIRLIRIGSMYEIPELTEAITHLEQLIADIQAEVMQARLVAVDMLFNRFPRMVRDLARKENKKINFIVKGTEIEIDRTILDKISEPLVHLLRNAVDHGIESVAERKNAGKSETGYIKLTASREKEHVVIEVSDDGKGIDSDRILDIAINKGFITSEEGVSLKDKEKVMLICASGLTTCKEATDVSGRGVGMDVVKTAIESIGGTLVIHSEKGSGFKTIMKFPLTMAIARGLLVKAGKGTFIVPLANVQEIVRVKADDLKTINGQKAISLRENVVPLIRLAKALELEVEEDYNTEFDALVVKIGDKRTGLVVDGLSGQQEIVIKTLDGYLKGVKGYAGATIMGDGKVAFILDMASLIT